ncbi:RDD family protein [Microbacterium gorillae]|uniref:RDD family protein n=1 Tax=Microbacterium gorillae TaxID=1231063 RepID=UPI0005910F35|nr:RDD family protein [Microbacterium gorillae]
MSTDVNLYPGERLGLPEDGPGSIGKLGRRIAALAIDYIPVIIIAIAFFDYDSIAVIVLFAVIQILFIPTIGGSPGHRIMGLRLVRSDGAWTGVWRPIVRTILLVLVIPAVIWDADHRGLHDKIAGTILVRAR